MPSPGLVLLLFALAAAGDAGGQPADPNCSDDQGIDRCDPEQQRRVRELFGVRSIEEHAAAGDQVRRAFYVDGYGHDVVAIAFVRAPGREPELWVHFARHPGVPPSEPLTAAVPEGVWEDIIRRSAHFDQDLFGQQQRVDPPRPGEEETIIMCIHSWVYTVEAADPPRREGLQPTVRRRTEDACQDGLARAYADELERAAVPLLPHCARLDPSLHRGEASLLAACRLLRGDRLAAAAVMNRVDLLRDVDGPEDTSLIRDFFDFESVVDWNGERNQGTMSAASFWVSKISEGQGRTILFYESVHGDSADRVRFVGLLSRPGAGSGYDTARVEQIWRREGEDFVIERIRVGPFEPSASD